MPSKRDFTDRFLKAIKPAPKGKRLVLMDAQVPNFGIRVTEHSSEESVGTFVLVARFPGSANPTRRSIGDYPAMTLAQARAVAREWRDDLARGIDPKDKAEALRREQARLRADTFGAVFERYDSAHLSTLRTGKAVKAAVRSHVFPAIENSPIREITRGELRRLIDNLKLEMPIGAIRVYAYLKTFFAWAVDQEYLDISPMASIKKPSGESERDRVLAEWEIRAIWRACDDLGSFGRAFKMMLATGQRRSEVGGMTWAEIDRHERLWSLSKERTKAARGHDVPLSDVAMEIIQAQPNLGRFVFASGRSGVGKGDDDDPSVALSGWGKAKERLDALASRYADEFAEANGDDPRSIPEWRLHDLRRTCATYMARLGVNRLVVGKVLNHAEQGVTKRYDRHEYAKEKRDALDLWSAKLSSIVKQTEEATSAELADAEA